VFGQAAAAPVPAPSTLWSFLGIPQGVKKVQGALTNRRGNRPGTEPKDALKALNDPANLESPDAAIKRAAEIKKAEDLKPQKIKAIKYLASIGCGCYDKDGSVTDALVAAAEDCTEDVRLATMRQIHSAATGKCCSNCGQVCCCNDKMLKKLAQIAYERDEFGCYAEPSKRVRCAAASALAACCPGSVPLEVLQEEPNETAPEKTPEPVPEREKQQDVVPEREKVLDERVSAEHHLNDRNMKSANGAEFSMNLQGSNEPERLPMSTPFNWNRSREGAASRSTTDSMAGQRQSVPAGIARMRNILASHPSHGSASPNPQGGVVLAYDESSKTAYVHFENAAATVPVGTMLHLRPDPRIASGFNGMWQVVESTAGCANLQPLGPDGIERIRIGDHAIFGTPAVVVAPISFTR
ncbi:MAG: hypothetical protein KDA51_07760, partial [Planctomycetales bacterium]|nr:hypothetical protein [Planctomycetales bacterium]